MTTIHFETAALADTLKKAARIAPMRGREFDSYAGILLSIIPGPDDEDDTVTVRTTDGAVFYTEWMNHLGIEGEEAHWRLPSKVVSDIVNALPIGSGKKCTFTEESGRIKISSGRTRASLGIIQRDYPEWDDFADDLAQTVPGFGARLEQVAWAVSRKAAQSNMAAVYLDGENIVATDGDKLVTAPLELPMDPDNVLVPVAVLAPILSQMTETRAAVNDRFLLLQPNDYTQIKCVLLGEKYPPVANLMNQATEETVMFNREHAIEIVQRIMTVIAKERQNNLDVTIGNGEMIFYTEDEMQMNSINDALDLDGQCQHEPIRYRFNPEFFLNAISKAPGMLSTLNYTPSKPAQPVRFEGEAGYRCWIIPRRAVIAP